jgi:hypothetical protein
VNTAIHANELRTTFGVPIYHNDALLHNNVLTQKSEPIPGSSLIKSDFEVLTRWCDYLNVRDSGIFRALPSLSIDSQSMKPVKTVYVMNDAQKAHMTRNSRAILVDLSERDRIDNDSEEAYCNTYGLKAARPTLDQLVLDPDGVVDFGFTIGNWDSDMIYHLAAQAGPIVGYGYLIAPELDCRKTQPVNVGEQEIGLIREVAQTNGNKCVFLKVDGKRYAFQHTYLNKCFEQVIPNPNRNLYDFSVEIQQIDRYQLFSCSLKRFRIVKKPHNSRFFDSCVGDEIFNDCDNLDPLTTALISPGVSTDEYYSFRATSAAAAVDAKVKPIVLKQVEVTEATQGIILRRRRKGRIFDYFQDVVTKVPVRTQSSVYNTIPRKVLNKVSLNFVNAPELTSQLLKTNLGYINNCMNQKDKDFSLIQDGIPAIIYCMKETKCLESMLAASLASKDAELTNTLKKGGFKVAPEGLKDAFQKGCLWEFISYKIRNLVKLNETEAVDCNETTLKGFQ